MFKEVLPGPSLQEDFLRLRKHVVGDESGKFAYEEKIHVVDAFRPQTYKEI